MEKIQVFKATVQLLSGAIALVDEINISWIDAVKMSKTVLKTTTLDQEIWEWADKTIAIIARDHFGTEEQILAMLEQRVVETENIPDYKVDMALLQAIREPLLADIEKDAV
jgi:hypothetical protein